MDSNNWRLAQCGGEPTMDTADWRSQLPPESRQRILNKIMETLGRHLPFSGQEGLMELKRIAVRFEEKIYTAATNKSEYLNKISRKMLSLVTKTPNFIAASTSNGRNHPDAVASMDSNNWRLAQGGGEPTMDTADWRSQLPPESRQRILNKIVETLGRRLPFSGQEGLMELKKIAVRFEEKIYTASTSQSEYLNKISRKMLSLETKTPNFIAASTSNGRNHPDAASLDSTTQIGNVHGHGGDWQEDVYQKIKAMKEAYLPELNELVQKVAGKLQQHDCLPEQPKNEQLENLKIFKTMMEGIMAFLQVPKSSILPGYRDKLDSYEKQIVSFLNSNRLRELTPLQMHPMQQQQQRFLGQQNSLSNLQQQQQFMSQQNSIPNMHHHHHQLQPSTSLDSTAQIGNVQGGDWQEDVYQKIKAMKEAYLLELIELYQKIAGILQQHDSLPEQPKNEQLEKLKIFKTMMERIMAFLQVPKSSILPGYKDKLGSYEKQIVSFLNSNLRRELTPLQMHPMQQPQQPQSQITHLNVVPFAGSNNDNFDYFHGLETSDLESTATSIINHLRLS